MPVHLDENVVKLTFLVVEGSPYDVIVGDPTMETMEGVLDLGNQVASFVVDGDKIEIPMEPDYIHGDPGYKSATDTDEFSSATSAGQSEEGNVTDSDTTEEELIVIIKDEDDGVRVACMSDTDRQSGSEGEHLANEIYPGISHLSKRQSKHIKRFLKHSEVVAYSLHELKQASVRPRHHF